MIKKNICRQEHCDKEPYSLGFCEEHYQILDQERKLRTDAIHALHTAQIDGELPTTTELREQLFEIRSWWSKACDSINHQRIDPILKDEAADASEWCIALTKEIVAAERANKSGQPPNNKLLHTNKWVYDRFNNLEKGLRSNGVPHSLR